MKISVFFIFSAVLLRILPHVPNFAPVTAIALFGGAYLDKRIAVILPLLIMAISDYFLGSIFHSTTLFVWGSFLISSFIGMQIGKRKSFTKIGIASILASVQFFIITNFGVWLATNMYPKTIEGLLQSYIMGIPFFRFTFLGDLFYTGMFFGGFELVQLITKNKILSRGREN